LYVADPTSNLWVEVSDGDTVHIGGNSTNVTIIQGNTTVINSNTIHIGGNSTSSITIGGPNTTTITVNGNLHSNSSSTTNVLRFEHASYASLVHNFPAAAWGGAFAYTVLEKQAYVADAASNTWLALAGGVGGVGGGGGTGNASGAYLSTIYGGTVANDVTILGNLRIKHGDVIIDYPAGSLPPINVGNGGGSVVSVVGNYLPLTGGTLTGPLNVTGDLVVSGNIISTGGDILAGGLPAGGGGGGAGGSYPVGNVNTSDFLSKSQGGTISNSVTISNGNLTVIGNIFVKKGDVIVELGGSGVSRSSAPSEYASNIVAIEANAVSQQLEIMALRDLVSNVLVNVARASRAHPNVSALETEVHAVEANVQSLESNVFVQLTALKALLSNVASNVVVASNVTSVKDLSSNVVALESNVASLAANAILQETEILALQRIIANATNNASVKGLSSNVIALESNVASLAANAILQETEILALQRVQQRIASDVANNTLAIANVKDFTSNIVALESNVASLTANAILQETEILALQRVQQRIASDVANNAIAIANVKNFTSNVVAEVNALRSNIVFELDNLQRHIRPNIVRLEAVVANIPPAFNGNVTVQQVTGLKELLANFTPSSTGAEIGNIRAQVASLEANCFLTSGGTISGNVHIAGSLHLSSLVDLSLLTREVENLKRLLHL